MDRQSGTAQPLDARSLSMGERHARGTHCLFVGHTPDESNCYCTYCGQAWKPITVVTRPCIRCGLPVHEEDGWWVDDEGDLTCWDKNNPDDLGPHEVFTDAEEDS